MTTNIPSLHPFSLLFEAHSHSGTYQFKHFSDLERERERLCVWVKVQERTLLLLLIGELSYSGECFVTFLPFLIIAIFIRLCHVCVCVCLLLPYFLLRSVAPLLFCFLGSWKWSCCSYFSNSLSLMIELMVNSIVCSYLIVI